MPAPDKNDLPSRIRDQPRRVTRGGLRRGPRRADRHDDVLMPVKEVGHWYTALIRR